MKIERAIRELQNSINVGLCPDVESRKLAIRSLEAWKAAKAEIELVNTMEMGRFGNSPRTGEAVLNEVMQIINKHLSEVEDEK